MFFSIPFLSPYLLGFYIPFQNKKNYPLKLKGLKYTVIYPFGQMISIQICASPFILPKKFLFLTIYPKYSVACLHGECYLCHPKNWA